ncbi:MAG: hypothetical protein FWF86_08585 [Clostridia bacterium]|nr:hypothetical protein [Clostridia bacterium]
MHKAGLPYVDNAKAVLLTVAINVGVVFLFHWPGGITLRGVLLDSVLCAGITVLIDLWMVHTRLRKMRTGGQMPPHVPVSRLMQRLPKNPVALGVIYAAVFGVLTAGVNGAVLWFFGMKTMAFAPWMVYKLVYAVLLSAKITEYCIFRYVQPDWAMETPGGAEPQKAVKPVKDPLPKVSVFKAMYGSVTGNIATNMIIGLALGGITIAPGGSVVISPTTVEGIPITGLIFGLIIGTLVTSGVVKEVNGAILAAATGPGRELPEMPVADKRFSWMPRRKGMLTALICVCMMILSAVALWSLMTLFGISVMNVYQYAIFITAYASVVSKPLSYVLVRRCTQPDYIRYVQKKKGNESLRGGSEL